MAYTTVEVSDTTLKDGLTPGLEGSVAAAFAALLENNIIDVQFITRDKERRSGRVLTCQFSYEDVGEVLLTSPYLLRTFVGRTAAEVLSLSASFQALQPGWFYAVPFIDYINQVAEANRPYVLYQFYCADANGVLNWKVKNPSSVAGVDPVVSIAVTRTLLASETYVRQTANGITTRLPAAPLSGELHHITHAGGGANNTLSGNGKNIESSSGLAATVALVDGDTIKVKYDLTNDQWLEFT